MSTSSTVQSSSDLHFCLSFQIFLKIMFFKLRNLSLKTNVKDKIVIRNKKYYNLCKVNEHVFQKCLTDENRHKEKSCNTLLYSTGATCITKLFLIFIWTFSFELVWSFWLLYLQGFDCCTLLQVSFTIFNWLLTWFKTKLT